MSNHKKQAEQIPLSLTYFNDVHLHSFIATDNQVPYQLLTEMASAPCGQAIYLWGAEATGKTHLLQGACQLASESKLQASYVPLNHHAQLSPEVIQGLHQIDFVAIDNIHAIAHQTDWEKNLLLLYDELREQQRSLVITSNQPINKLNLSLADLSSRLYWAHVYKLKPPHDETKRQVLKQKALSAGFELSEEVMDYLMRRVDRSLASLLILLNQLNKSSLSKQHPITIPFVRNLLGDL